MSVNHILEEVLNLSSERILNDDDDVMMMVG